MAEQPPAQRQLQVLTDEYQKLQGELQTTVEARQRLEAQQQENLSVQREFKALPDSSGIYKLVGPVLLKQERVEAKGAVDGRLEYINGEIKRREGQLKELQEKSDGKRMEVYQMQVQVQQEQQGEGEATAG